MCPYGKRGHLENAERLYSLWRIDHALLGCLISRFPLPLAVDTRIYRHLHVLGRICFQSFSLARSASPIGDSDNHRLHLENGQKVRTFTHFGPRR